MAVPTVAVTVEVFNPDGTPMEGATITARLSSSDVYQDQLVARETETETTDAAGQAVLDLFPNTLGENGTIYRFKITDTSGRTIRRTTAIVPNNDCNLTDIADNVSSGALNTSTGSSGDTGIVVRRTATETTGRTIVVSGELEITNADGVDGDILIDMPQALQGRTLTAPAAGFTITNPDGVSGDPTFELTNDLEAVEGLTGAGLAVRTADDTWEVRSLTGGDGLTISDPLTGDITIELHALLVAIAALAATGLVARTGAGTAEARTITGTANQVTVTNGDGAAGNPTLSLPQDIHTGATPSFVQVALAGDPVSALQAATKQYVDNLLAGLRPKASVKCRTTANVDLAGGGLANGTTHDGKVVATGDRVLVPSQTAPAENGLYIVPASGAASRATDMDAWAEVPGAMCVVEEGTTYADTGWVCTSNSGGTLGTTAITWVQFLGTGAYQPLDADLTALAGLTSAADRLPYFTGASAAALATFTAFARTLLDDADAATARGTLGLVIGTDVAAMTGANSATEALCIAASDETTPLTTGTSKVTFRMPYAFTLSAVRGSLSTAQTSGSIFTVDINEAGTTILSTKLTIDNTEKTSTTAATPPVISDTALADDAEITIDIDQVGDGTAKGLKVWLIGKKA